MPQMKQNNKKIANWINFREISHFIFLFIFIFVILLIVMNLGNISSHFQYTLKQILPTRIEVVGEAAMTKTSQAKPKPQINSIFIPKISVSAPIILSKSDREKDVLLALKEGVVLYPSFSRPGEKGTVIISGHSSAHIFYRGGYNTVFTLLRNLIRGDEVIIYYNNEKFIYKTINKYKFSPNVEIERQKEKPLLLLITCDPPGTDRKRLVIEAELIK